MADIKITWDAANQRGDWTVANGDLVAGGDLENYVLICLFTDAALPQNIAPPDGSDDHRGWCGDSYFPLPYGSLLWTLRRVSISSVSALLQQAKDICQNALAPLLTDGIASSVTVYTNYIGQGQLGITVVITEPSGVTAPAFDYQYAWGGVFS